MSQENTSSILDDKIALVSVNIGIFAGYRRATRETITALGGNLPDCAAVTEGSIKVFPNEALKEFQTIRRALFRAIASKGIKAMGSGNVFAVPKDALNEIDQEITNAEGKFGAELAKLDHDYETVFEKHIAANTKAETIIRSLKVEKAAALAKMHFGTTVFRILPVIREGEDHGKGVESIVAGLARRLFEEVADVMVETAENDAFTKKGRAGQKTLRPIKAAVAKMRGLEFLEPRLVSGAIGLVGEVLSTLPKDGYIEDVGQDQPFSRLRKLVELMGDADDLVNAASKFANGISANDVLFPVVKAEPAPATQPEPEEVTQPEAVEAPEAGRELEVVPEQAATPVPAPTARPIPAMAARPANSPLPKLPFAPVAPRVRAPARLI